MPLMDMLDIKFCFFSNFWQPCSSNVDNYLKTFYIFIINSSPIVRWWYLEAQELVNFLYVNQL